jgi:hypothetical protein
LIKHGLVLASMVSAALALTACSSGSSSHPSAQSQLSEITSVTQPSVTSSASTGPTINPADVDVCGLLTSADANKVAHVEELDEFQTATEVYTLTATKQADPAGSSCKFQIEAPQDAGEGSVVFHVRSATGFTVPPDGEVISGLGDEAYDTGVSPVVRVGTVVISSDEDSFSDDFVVSLLRLMVPKLK